MCVGAHLPRVKSDDLLVLLAVSRHRTHTAAARELDADHTTVARRLPGPSSRWLAHPTGRTRSHLQLSRAREAAEIVVLTSGGPALRRREAVVVATEGPTTAGPGSPA